MALGSCKFMDTKAIGLEAMAHKYPSQFADTGRTKLFSCHHVIVSIKKELPKLSVNFIGEIFDRNNLEKNKVNNVLFWSMAASFLINALL